jgi:hypothetical protein
MPKRRTSIAVPADLVEEYNAQRESLGGVLPIPSGAWFLLALRAVDELPVSERARLLLEERARRIEARKREEAERNQTTLFKVDEDRD